MENVTNKKPELNLNPAERAAYDYLKLYRTFDEDKKAIHESITESVIGKRIWFRKNAEWRTGIVHCVSYNGPYITAYGCLRLRSGRDSSSRSTLCQLLSVRGIGEFRPKDNNPPGLD